MHKTQNHDCFGCSLCLLVCPVWHHTGDVSLSPKSNAIALKQLNLHGNNDTSGRPDQLLSKSALSCILCGACNTVCPGEIDLLGMNMALRRRFNGTHPAAAPSLRVAGAGDDAEAVINSAGHKRIFLPGAALQQQQQRLQTVCGALNRLGRTTVLQGYHELAQALEFGMDPGEQLPARFLDPLRRARTIIVDDGLLLRALKEALPKCRIVSLGEQLSRLACSNISNTDLYVIDSRSYHADFERLRPYYHRLQNRTGCAMNLDLQRVAQPTLGQVSYRNRFNKALDGAGQTARILAGKPIQRIVVENMADMEEFFRQQYPVLHIGELVA